MEKKIMERKVSLNEARYYLSAWGNENIIRNYVAYFEKKLEDEVAKFKNVGMNVSSAYYPNFAAWIRFYTELTCNSLYWRLFRYEGECKNVISMRFKDLRKSIFEKIDEYAETLSNKLTQKEMNNMKKSIDLIINLRHSFQHGGLPNLMRDLNYGVSEKELASMLNPNKYRDTKEIYLNAEKLLKILPQRTVHF